MKLDIFEGRLARNKGHSLEKHGGRINYETRYAKGCYRCLLLYVIAKEKAIMEHRPVPMKREIRECLI